MHTPEIPKAGATLSTLAYERLRREIVRAVFLPEQKLHIGQLCERYGIGLSPIREALNRLSRDGLVVQNDQRGFSVAPFSNEHLDDLTKTRAWLNELALRESIAHADMQWEERVVLAYHRLSKLDRHDDGPDGAVSDRWEEAHREFHASLVAGCGSSWLIRYCEQLFDAAERYRYLSRLPRRQGLRAGRDEHKAILEAVVARDAPLAVSRLQQHFAKTAALVRQSPGIGATRDGVRPIDSTLRKKRRHTDAPTSG
jgi:GntR family carbon starvation induced transcriptional regulator